MPKTDIRSRLGPSQDSVRSSDVAQPTLAAVIRFHRRKSGLTQTQLAKMAGIGKTSVFDVEKGKESVRLNTLLRILSVLNIRLDMKSPLMTEFAKLQSATDGRR